jgi:uncharacterized protein
VRILDGQFLYSATDLVRFAECRHHLVLDVRDLQTPLTRTPNSEEAQLFADKGDQHELAHLKQLRAEHPDLVEIDKEQPFAQACEQTIAAMKAGAPVIFQAAVQGDSFGGFIDFLYRVDAPVGLKADLPSPAVVGRPSGRHPASQAGLKADLYQYEVADTKLARSTKTKFLIQIGLYSDLVAQLTGALPERMHLILGTGERVSYRVADYIHYLRLLRADFLTFVAAPPADTYPLPVAFCAMCQWSGLCDDKRAKDDHLSGVAGMMRSQTQKLERAGIKTIATLAELRATATIPALNSTTLAKLRTQAAMQVRGRKAGKPLFEHRAGVEPGKGFARLPPPSAGDIYFDFEGDPLIPDGLEYLFGVGYFDNGQYKFWPLWAHDRAEERAAFTRFMQWLHVRLARYPDLHIYHYAAYEPSALKRLMSLHGLHESDVDQLLRDRRFVDLYQVVREALVISEPAYSLKNVEKFFMPARTGAVASAGASVVWYERWRENRDQKLLDTIEDYNRFDVESTLQLANWLRGLAKSVRPEPVEGRASTGSARTDSDGPNPFALSDDDGPTKKSDRLIAHEAALAKFQAVLLGNPVIPAKAGIHPSGPAAPPTMDSRLRGNDDKPFDSLSQEEQSFRHLTYSLLDFHRRAEKPEWWALFERGNLDHDELLEDTECIAGCELAMKPSERPRSIKDNFVYRYPPQDFKLREGDEVWNAAIAEAAGRIVAIDEDACRVTVKSTGKAFPLPDRIDLCGGRPYNTEPLKEALKSFAQSVSDNDGRFRAVHDLLRRHAPRIKGRNPGDPVLRGGRKVLDDALDALLALQDSVLFIQGPPGCGKTYSASSLIVELIRRGKTVGVASNSHKAINNLLGACEQRAHEKGVSFRGLKKYSKDDPEDAFNGDFITADAKASLADGLAAGKQLLAGTAWFFAKRDEGRPLDYLFIDEAGQVSLANTVVMGLAARNLVLVGDQMQLNQPIKGIHPGHSGESALEYLLDGHATVAPDRGILLEETWRLHPDICRFISDAVYDGRLRAHPKNAQQQLILGKEVPFALSPSKGVLKPTGLLYVPVPHDGNSQKSEEEAQAVKALYLSLLQQRYRDDKGAEHPMTPNDILVVAPYNVQVNLLKKTLPAGARVGTVDKFQGQEAQVVLISMATSNSETVPRNLDFLFSRNRLNVAISRARCLSVLVCSPELPRIRCSTPEQMALVNTLGWFVREAQTA